MKISQLKAHLDGTALSTVERLPTSEFTYDSAIDLLKETFAYSYTSSNLDVKLLKVRMIFVRLENVHKILVELRSLENLVLSITDIFTILCTSISKALPQGCTC